MPVIIPSDLPAKEILEKERIFTILPQRAKHQDIRPLRIAIFNLMPKKEETETQFLRMLSNTPLQVYVDLIHTASYESKNTCKSHLSRFYRTFDEIRHRKYDAMIITGAPVEKMDFEEVLYWNELREIFEFAKTNVFSTMFICWASQAALYHYYGIRKHEQADKIFGVFDYEVRHESLLTKGFDDIFYTPQSRYTYNRLSDIIGNEGLHLVAGDEATGANIVLSSNQRQIFVAGHFEYDKDTLYNEYVRDKNQGLDTALPCNYFANDDESKGIDGITVKWRSYANLLFSNWLNYLVYQETPFDLSEISENVAATSERSALH